MNPTTLSALALAGLGPFLGAAPKESAPAQEPKKQEKPAKEAIEPDAAKTIWEYLSGRYDANGDGKISKEEYKRGSSQFARLDKDKNGFIEAADTKQQGRRGVGRGRGGARRPAVAPTEGTVAPDFELETLYPKKVEKTPANEPKSTVEKPATYESVKLSSLKGKKPVALIFGSYT